MTDAAGEELVVLSHAWDRAMVANDADAIAGYMAEDWTIVGSDGSIGRRESFLARVLTHLSRLEPRPID